MYAIALLFLGLLSSPQPVTHYPLPRIEKPNVIAWGEGHLYIVEEDSRIHRYRLDPSGPTWLSTFGRSGEGPGELGWIHRMRVRQGYLEIPNNGRYVRFTPEGHLSEEIRLPHPNLSFKNNITRINDQRYLVTHVELGPEGFQVSIRLLKSDFSLHKELLQDLVKSQKGKIALISDSISAQEYQDQIFLCHASAEQTRIAVTSTEGQELRTFTLPLESQEVTPAMQDRMTRNMRIQDPSDFKEIAKRLWFPEKAPGLDRLHVHEQMLICRTYEAIPEKEQVVFAFFDLQGNPLGRQALFDSGRQANGTRYCLGPGCLLSIREGEAEDADWELWIEPINLPRS